MTIIINVNRINMFGTFEFLSFDIFSDFGFRASNFSYTILAEPCISDPAQSTIFSMFNDNRDYS
jgi:hypothetical protein